LDILLGKQVVAFLAISLGSLSRAQGWMTRWIGIIRFTAFVGFRGPLTRGDSLRGVFFLWKIFGRSVTSAGSLRRVSRIGALTENLRSRLFTPSWSEDKCSLKDAVRRIKGSLADDRRTVPINFSQFTAANLVALFCQKGD
jgi:hypothetical protein